MSVRDWRGKLNPGSRTGRRVTKALMTFLAVTTVCSGLTWTVVSLTGNSADAKAPVACSYTATGGRTSVGLPTFDAAAASRPYTATLVTNRGDITFEALTQEAPCATTSFSFLAGKKYFDDSKCHRLTTRGIFVLECGDPDGKGTADPGYFFTDENLGGSKYTAGTVSMSKAVPGRNGSQFFITYADPKVRMGPNWTTFGKVISGMDVLHEIADRGTADESADGRPRNPVVIESVTVARAAAPTPGKSRD